MAERNRRRTFWPVVLLGVAGSGLAAMAGSKHWASLVVPPGAKLGEVSVQAAMAAGNGSPALDAPGVTALSLVALAAWGVALVTRGIVRRGILAIAAIASAAGIPVGIDVLRSLPSDTSLTAWPWIAFVGLVISLAAAVVGVFWAPQWPEMGRRYDAPTTGPQLPDNLDEADNIDLWKTISEGHDPTSDRD